MIILGTVKGIDLDNRIDLAIKEIHKMTVSKKLLVICSGLGEEGLISEA